MPQNKKLKKSLKVEKKKENTKKKGLSKVYSLKEKEKNEKKLHKS